MLTSTPGVSGGAITPKPTAMGQHASLVNNMDRQSEAQLYRMRLSPARSVPKLATVNEPESLAGSERGGGHLAPSASATWTKAGLTGEKKDMRYRAPAESQPVTPILRNNFMGDDGKKVVVSSFNPPTALESHRSQPRQVPLHEPERSGLAEEERARYEAQIKLLVLQIGQLSGKLDKYQNEDQLGDKG